MPDTLREKIARTIYGEDKAWGYVYVHDDGSTVAVTWEQLGEDVRTWFYDRADAVLAVLREHLGSDEVVERAAKASCNAGDDDWDTVGSPVRSRWQYYMRAGLASITEES